MRSCAGTGESKLRGWAAWGGCGGSCRNTYVPICMALRVWLAGCCAEYLRQLFSCGEAACSWGCVWGVVMGTAGLTAVAAAACTAPTGWMDPGAPFGAWTPPAALALGCPAPTGTLCGDGDLDSWAPCWWAAPVTQRSTPSSIKLSFIYIFMGHNKYTGGHFYPLIPREDK